MSLFDRIKDAIFGRQTKADSPQVAQQVPDRADPAPAPQHTLSTPQVDVEAILNDLSAKSGQKLNWRISIVDLLKLLGLDSNLVERKNLARELGYTGTLDGSAEMNTWLHQQVMRKLASNGGKIPADLLK